jgi:acyl carrier protein
MADINTRLTRCFALTFPALDPAVFPQASTETLAEWDSIAQINLLTLIGEEFAIEVDYEQFEDATSFPALANRVASLTGESAG